MSPGKSFTTWAPLRLISDGQREKDEERDTWCVERRMTDKLSLNYSGTERQKGGRGKARSGGGGESAELQGVFNCQ